MEVRTIQNNENKIRSLYQKLLESWNDHKAEASASISAPGYCPGIIPV